MEPTLLIGRSALWRALCLLSVLLQVHAAVDRTSRGHAALRISQEDAEHGVARGEHGAHGVVAAAPVAAPVAEGIEPFPVPEVRHVKEAGNGYLEHSPLYARQEAKRLTQELDKPPVVARLDKGKEKVAVEAAVSTTMECVINLTGQFFFVYTAWFVVQALNRLKLIEREREERCLVAVVETVFFVPMLCVLFLASRLRALQLSQGDPAKWMLPPWYVKLGMLVCTWSVFWQTVLVFACTMAHGELWEAVVRKQGIGRSGRIMMAARNILMFCIYAGFTTVCVGTVMMESPAALWGARGGPPVSPAVQCTMVLTLSYFAVYLALAMARLSNEVGLMGQTLRFSSAQELLITATATVAFAPMLSVLFMAARIQALHFDFRNGNPARWVQLLFYVCTGSILLQAGIAVSNAFVGPRNREDSRDYPPRPVRSVSTLYQAGSPMDVLRSISVMVVHVSVVLIIVGLYIGRPRGDAAYGTMPTPLKCTLILTALYFLVHLALWAVRHMQRSKPHLPGSTSPIQSQRTDDLSSLEVFLGVRAKEAVAFCPMFCILFLSTLMRSLQISGNKGAPPPWCQNLTVLATWSIVFLTLSRVDVLIPRANRFVTVLCTATQYICLLLLYLSAISIVAALFTMSSDAGAIPALL